ncbi:hypothetical protein LCGC14_2844170, partial [marine sediment metagenome]
MYAAEAQTEERLVSTQEDGSSS